MGVLAVDGRQRQRDGDQLRPLVLDAGAAVRHGPQRAGIAAVQVDPVGRVGGGPAAGQCHEFGAVDAARPGDQVDGRRLVVRLQRRFEFGVRRAAAERVADRRDDPPRVGPRERQMPLRVGALIGCQPVDPGLQVRLADPAQHRVDVPGSARPLARPDQVDGGRDRRVRGNPGVQQLVGAQPEGVDDHAVQVGEGAVAAGPDDRVELPEGPAGAVGQFGGQRGVPAGDAPLGEQSRQREVGVGALRSDRGQHVEGDPPGLVRGGRFAGGRPPRRAAGAASLGPVRLTARRAVPARVVVPSRAVACAVPIVALSGRLPRLVRSRSAAARRRSAGGPGTSAARRHRSTCPDSGRTPRAQSAAGIGRRPGGVSLPSRTAVVPVPTRTSFLATDSSPAARPLLVGGFHRTDDQPSPRRSGPRSRRRRQRPDRAVHGERRAPTSRSRRPPP